jgi:hypothetical protein
MGESGSGGGGGGGVKKGCVGGLLGGVHMGMSKVGINNQRKQ